MFKRNVLRLLPLQANTKQLSGEELQGKKRCLSCLSYKTRRFFLSHFFLLILHNTILLEKNNSLSSYLRLFLI